MNNSSEIVSDVILAKTVKHLRTGLVVLLCASTVFSSGATFAQSNDNNGAKGAAQQITLNLDDVDILVLINTVAEVSGKNFIVDPRVKGKVSVISGAPLEPEQLYDMFLSILEVHNYSTVASGNVVKVVPNNIVKQRPTPTLFGATKENNDAQITQIIKLKHAPVQDLQSIVRPLIPATSHFAVHIPSNSIIFTDTTANIQRVLKIIKSIDVPDKRSITQVVYLNYASANALASTLTQSFVNSADQANANRVSIQAMDSINALVVNAPDDEFIKIQALIDELDIQREVKSNVNVVYLKHADAAALVSVLSDVTNNSGGNDGGVRAEFSVQADEATNSLIVKAEPAEFLSVKSIIDKLDIRRAQVYVEAVIANVSTDQMESFGVNWDLGDQIDLSGDGGVASRSLAAGITGDASNFNLTGSQLTYNLFNSGSDQLNAIITAIRSDTNSNILSTPTILTLDNEEAEIIVGQEVPFVTGSFTSATDGGDGNAFQTIERQDVGTQLRIRPQINDGNTIRLEVEQEISSVVATELNDEADLITNTSSIQAIVQVDHGQVIVLGGLTSDTVSDTITGVPVLSKIPVLGALFRSKVKDVDRQNLMVFLKPYIVRTPEELEYYSRIRYNQTRQAEQESLKGSAKYLVPGAKPAVLDEYDNVTGDGTLGTARTRKLEAKYQKKELKKAERARKKAEKAANKTAETISESAQ